MTPACLAPWTHLFHHSDGAVYPCCRFAGDAEFSVSDTTTPIQDAWNSHRMRMFRKRMLEGDLPATCKECIAPHIGFHRVFDRWQSNTDFSKTADDGEFPLNYQMFNVTASNICNFRCIYCRHDYSSQIVDAATNKPRVMKSFDSPDAFKRYFDPLLESVDMFVFAGGESAIQDDFYWLLNELLARKLTHKKVYFVTNLSTLKHKNQHIGEILSNFSDATIAASIDGSAGIGYIQRTGTRWSTITANRVELLNYPSVRFGLQSVLTCYSILDLPNFHKQWVDKGWLTVSGIRYIVLTDPPELSIRRVGYTSKNTTVDLANRLADYYDYLSQDNDPYFNGEPAKDKIAKITQFILDGDEYRNQ